MKYETGKTKKNIRNNAIAFLTVSVLLGLCLIISLTVIHQN